MLVRKRISENELALLKDRGNAETTHTPPAFCPVDFAVPGSVGLIRKDLLNLPAPLLNYILPQICQCVQQFFAILCHYLRHLAPYLPLSGILC